MLLRTLSLSNYTAFSNACFDLTPRPDRPIILFLGNNGAGKTSTLNAFQLALQGRRSFLGGASESSYQNYTRALFHNGDTSRPCAIELVFDYSEGQETSTFTVRREWTIRRSKVAEKLTLTIDETAISSDIAEDLLVRLIPPEVLSYFFFDGERIGEIVDWDSDDDSSLFSSVNELLGLNIAAQLQKDLDRVLVSSAPRHALSQISSLSASLEAASQLMKTLGAETKDKKRAALIATRRLERARRTFGASGGAFAQYRTQDEAEVAALRERASDLAEAIRHEAAGYMPLLIAPEMLATLLSLVQTSEDLEVLNAVRRALDDSETALKSRLAKEMKADLVVSTLAILRDVLTPRPVALDSAALDLSIREAAWMRSVLIVELPKVVERLRRMVLEFDSIQAKVDAVEARLAATPPTDGPIATALSDLEGANRELAIAQNDLALLENDLRKAVAEQEALSEKMRKARNEHFRSSRLQDRDRVVERLLAALPQYAARLQHSKQERFAQLLFDALAVLWHKQRRINGVNIDISAGQIDLETSNGPLLKSALSAAEKQLFAIGFIFSLAKLSNRSMPFAIDTPLARLDKKHRTNLLARFLPESSHQILLFSTDTEVVGHLYSETKDYVSHAYELADFNSGITERVDLEGAL